VRSPRPTSGRKRRRWPAPDPGRAARLVFAAKKAACEARRPLSGRLLDFAALAVDWGPGDRLGARFQAAAQPFAPGDRLIGRFARSAGLALAGFGINRG